MAWFENFRKNPTNYNNFFHPNVCHVCKWKCHGELKSCADCRMISYCSEEHRMLHREEHETICEAIGKMSNIRNFWDSRGMELNQWLIFKKENVQVIQAILHRKLKPYEEQIFLFAKSCGICRQQSNLTSTCQNCFSVNTCAEHESSNIKHDCHLLEISLWLDTYDLAYNYKRMPYSFLPNCVNTSFLIGGMELFINFCRKRDELELTWNADHYNFSNYLSKPLTVLNAMNYARFTSRASDTGEFVIHIIDGFFTDTCTISAWEVFLHTLGERTELLIIILGTKLERVLTWDVCDMCRASDKRLRFEYRTMLYEDYIKSVVYVEPDFVIGFDMDLRNSERNTITAFLNQKCPLVLTAKSANNEQDNITRIQRISGIKPTYSSENDFKSMRPYRDFENDTFFPNKYLTIYNHTYPQNNLCQASSSHQVGLQHC